MKNRKEQQRDEVVVPVVEETAEISKRVVERGTVRLSKVVSEREEIIPASLLQDEIEIEHVARDQWLEKPAETRQEGDTLIVPVMEEVLVVEKRLKLREEIHIRRRTKTVSKEERVTLRKEEIHIEDERN
jgi:stress response protein YsnF